MTKLKIATFHNLIYGGAKRSVFELIKIISQRCNVDFYRISVNQESLFDLCSIAQNTHTSEYKGLYFKIRPFSYLNAFMDFINLYRLNRIYHRIADRINKSDYDVVFIGHCQYTYAPRLLRYLNKPTVYYSQEPWRRFYEPDIEYKTHISLGKLIYDLFFWFIHKLYKIFLKINDRKNIGHASLILCNSRYSQQNLYRTYSITAKINYLGVDAHEFKPLGLVKENLVLSIGHLEPRKAHDFVIKAISKVKHSIKPRLGIVYPIGSDAEKEYKGYLEKLADNCRVKVSFFVQIADEELVSIYNQAKITLCAFVNEPFGLVPLESMACQTPVIAVDEAGLKESVVNNETGILVERDLNKFADALEYLLTRDEIRIKMGQNGREHVLKNWTWEKSAEELERNFLNVIKNG